MAENHLLFGNSNMQLLYSWADLLRERVEHVGHFSIGPTVEFESISMRHPTHLKLQLKSLIAKIGVSMQITLDFCDGFGGAAETFISSLSLLMMVSNVVVIVRWLLNSDKTVFCKPRTSPSLNSRFSARSLHSTRSIWPAQ